jgi:hypothetical protein
MLNEDPTSPPPKPIPPAYYDGFVDNFKRFDNIHELSKTMQDLASALVAFRNVWRVFPPTPFLLLDCS